MIDFVRKPAQKTAMLMERSLDFIADNFNNAKLYIYRKPYYRQLGMRSLNSYEISEINDEAKYLNEKYGINLTPFNAKQQFLILSLHGVDEDTVVMFKRVATYRLDNAMDKLFMFLCTVVIGTTLVILSSTISSCHKHETDNNVAKTKLMLEHGFTEEDMEKWHNHELLTGKLK